MNADELQAMQALNLAVDGYRERAEAAESRLAAANALLERINRCGGLGLDVYEWIDDYLAAQEKKS